MQFVADARQQVGGEVGAQAHPGLGGGHHAVLRQFGVAQAVQQVQADALRCLLGQGARRGAEGQHAAGQRRLALHGLERQLATLREAGQRHARPGQCVMARPVAHALDETRQRGVELARVPAESAHGLAGQGQRGIERQHHRLRVLAVQGLGQRLHLRAIGAVAVQQQEEQIGHALLGQQGLGVGFGQHAQALRSASRVASAASRARSAKSARRVPA